MTRSLPVLVLLAALAHAQVPERIPPELGTSGPAYVQAWQAYAAGDYERAQILGEAQLALDRTGGNQAAQAEGLNLLGTVLYKHGAYDRALPIYLEAEKLAEASHYSFGLARDASSLGSTYFRLGKLQLAKQYYEHSLALRRGPELRGDRAEIARALNDLANVYQRLNDLPGAMRRRQEALALFQAADSDLGVADVLNDIGWTYDDMGDYPNALACMQRSVELSRKLAYPWGVNDGTESAGLIYQHMGHYPEALAAMQSALAGFRQGDERDEVARTLTHMGDTALSAGDATRATDYYQQALGLELEIGNRPIEGATLPGLMRAWQAAGKPALAIFYGKQAVNLFQEMRGDIRALDPQLQKSFLRDKEEVYRALAGLLLAQRRVAEAQHVLDMLKEEEYFDFVDRDPAESGLTLHATASGKEAGLEEQMAALSARLAAIGSERAALLERKQLSAAEQQRLQELDQRLRAASEEFQQWLARVPQALGSAEAATGVDEMERHVRGYGPGVAVLYTLVGADRYRALLVTAHDVTSVERPVTHAGVNRMVQAFRAALAPNADARDAGRKLYDLVLGPFAAKLAGVHTILFSLDGALRLAPMAALYDGRHYVVERFETVVITPAAEPWLADADRGAWRPLALGVSRAHDPFPALPSVRGELDAVVAASGSGRTRLDTAFTAPEMKLDLRRHFDVVHIASHFAFQPGHVGDSFLLLGDGSRLSLAAMEKMPWLFSGVDLLTLSACNTAQSAAAGNGKEVDGFSILAQRRGAKAVLATLWPVADRSTALLMQRFYQARHAHRAAGKAEALRSAQLSLLRSRAYPQPFFWAPFVLAGNWK